MQPLKNAVAKRAGKAVMIALYVALIDSTLVVLDHFFPEPPVMSLGTLP